MSHLESRVDSCCFWLAKTATRLWTIGFALRFPAFVGFHQAISLAVFMVGLALCVLNILYKYVYKIINIELSNLITAQRFFGLTRPLVAFQRQSDKKIPIVGKRALAKLWGPI